MDHNNSFSRSFGKIFGLIGLVFLVIGLIFLFVFLSTTGGTALAFNIVGSVFIKLGGTFTMIGAISLTIARNTKRKRDKLMRSGVCYNGEIVRVYDNLIMSINNRSPFIVECTYKDRYGKTYLVKSGNIWPGKSRTMVNDVKAKVWLNPDNPKDYFVEVSFDSNQTSSNIKYDYDYC